MIIKHRRMLMERSDNKKPLVFRSFYLEIYDDLQVIINYHESKTLLIKFKEFF